MDKKILVTGASGFIGFHLCKSLMKDNVIVHGIDNNNDYYDVNLKLNRLNKLEKDENFTFHKVDITDKELITEIFNTINPDIVVNLAAQAGVRYSIENPYAYIDSNIVGFLNLIELSRNNKIDGFIYASSSSVYGGNEKIPFSVEDRVEAPMSLYAATKIANEMIAKSYSHLYNLHTTGLRFFTVYGPWGRPDMAMYIFARNIQSGNPIKVFNNGHMKRDFTYIDDIVNGIKSAINNNYQCEVFNLGNNNSEELMDVIKLIEYELGLEAEIDFLPMQPGDVHQTYADIDKSIKMLNYSPSTGINSGVKNFIDWFKDYHSIKKEANNV